jgi:cytochrome c oxidase assembly factor CtaG
MNMVLSHWSANPAVLAATGAVAVTHLLGMRAALGEAKRLAPPRPAAAQTAAFYGGLCAAVVALVSPLAYWAGEYVWVRSMQDVLLAVAAPGLIVLGGPWLVLRHGAAACLRLTGTAARRPAGTAARQPIRPGMADRPVRQDRRPSPAPLARSWMTWPVIATVVFNIGWLGWHLPAPYDAALRHPAASAAEVVTYLGLGIAFWLQLIGSGPITPRLSPLSRVVLVAGTATATAVLAMVLMFGAGKLYPAYAGPAHRILGLVADQQLGGAVLLALALPPFVITAIALCIRWVAAEESEALDAGFDRLLRPSASAWPSWPGFRSSVK